MSQRHAPSTIAIQHAYFRLCDGLLKISYANDVINHMVFCNEQDEDNSQQHPLPTHIHNALTRYATGQYDALDELAFNLSEGTAFQQSVWLALGAIPAGTTWSYQQLAISIGRPAAVRAIGQALKRNPLAVRLPCHRVIQKNGKLGGYAGASAENAQHKIQLLRHEMVPINQPN